MPSTPLSATKLFLIGACIEPSSIWSGYNVREKASTFPHMSAFQQKGHQTFELKIENAKQSQEVISFQHIEKFLCDPQENNWREIQLLH
jgi:hypothetical protein